MHVSEMPEGLIRAAFSAAEGVSVDSVIIISLGTVWAPRGGKVEKLKVERFGTFQLFNFRTFQLLFRPAPCGFAAVHES